MLASHSSGELKCDSECISVFCYFSLLFKVSKEIMFRVFGTPIKSIFSYFQPAASLTEIMKSSGFGHLFTCGRMTKNSPTASLKLVSEMNHLAFFFVDLSCNFFIYSVARGMHGLCFMAYSLNGQKKKQEVDQITS